MKVFACLAVLALAVAGCSIHETTTRTAAPATAYVVPAPAPGTTVYVPVN
jgi:hypothetical protein